MIYMYMYVYMHVKLKTAVPLQLVERATPIHVWYSSHGCMHAAAIVWGQAPKFQEY